MFPLDFRESDVFPPRASYDIYNIDFQNQDLDFGDIPWRKDTRLAIEGSAVSKINAFEYPNTRKAVHSDLSYKIQAGHSNTS